MAKIAGKLCVFGCFKDSELYSRNRILITALSTFFDEVVELRPDHELNKTPIHLPLSSPKGILRALWMSASGFASLFRQRRSLNNASLYFVPYPAYLDLIFLRLLTRKRNRPKIAIDAFLCLHDTVVYDRKLFGARNPIARGLKWLEAHTLHAADLIFIDTEQQRAQLASTYNLDGAKLIVTPVGIDEALWRPLPALPLAGEYRVLFWGTFIPLHGVETIIGAARVLADTYPDIRFTLVGDGQTADSIAKNLDDGGLDNVAWNRELVSATILRSYVENAHCILGIFGSSEKAGYVIPYKAYQAMASNKILITREGPAFFSQWKAHEPIEGLVLVAPGSAQALADTIVSTFVDYERICQNLKTREAYEQKLSNQLLLECVQRGLKLL